MKQSRVKRAKETQPRPRRRQSPTLPEEQLRVTLYSIGDAVIVTDTQGRVTLMNPVAEALTGWNEADALGKPLAQVFHILNEETRTVVENPVARVLRDGVVIGLANHTLLIARDGREIPIADSGAPVRDARGKIVGVVLVFRDQTKERQAQRLVHQARDFAESIVATVREPLVVLDAHLRVISANHAFYRTFQVTPAETEGHPIYELGNRQWDIPELRALLEQILPHNSHFDDFVVEHEFERIGKRTMLLNARRIRHASDQTQMILLAIEDISDRPRAADALRESEERFRLLAESSLTGIYLIQDGRFRYVNRALASTFGYDVAEVVDKLGPLDLTHPADRRMVQENIRRRIEGESESIRYEFRGLRKDGSSIDILVHGRRIEHEGRPAIIGTLIDITERKRAEALQRQQLAELQVIYQLSTAVSRAESVEKIYEQALAALLQALKADRASILLFDSDGVMRFKAQRGLSEEYLKAVEGHSPWTREAQNPPPILVEDVEREPTLERLKPAILREGIRALGFIPLIQQDRLVGKFMLYFNTPHCFTEDEIRLTQTIAAHVAFAIERKRAEEELRTREMQYRSLFEQSHDAIFILDLQGRHLAANQRAADLLGYSPAELLRLSFRETSAEIPQSEKVLARLLRGEHVPLYERKFRRKNGEIIWTEINVELVRDAQGKPLHIQSVVRDITERKHHERQLEAQAMLARALGESLELQPLLERLLQAARHAIPAAEKGSILLLEADGKLRIRALNGYSDPRLKEFAFANDAGYSARAARERRPLLIADVRADPEIRYDGEIEEARQIHSAIAVPLLIQERVIGVLSLDSTRKDAFTQQDLNHLVSFAASAALVIENAHLFEETHRRAEELASLYESAQLLAGKTALEQVLQAITQSIARLFGTTGAGLYLYDPLSQTLEVKLATHATIPIGLRLALGEGLAGKVAQSRRLMRIDDYMRWEGRSPKFEGIPVRATMEAPLVYQDQLVGVLVVHETGASERKFTEADERLLSLFAVQAAAAIQNARLFEETHRRLTELETLHTIASLCIQATDENSLLEQVTDVIGNNLYPDNFGFLLLNAEGTHLVAHPAYRGVTLENIPTQIPLNAGITGRVAASGKPYRTGDVRREDAYIEINPATRSELCVPLIVGGRVLGVINAESNKLNAFSEADEHLLMTAASQVATALERLRLLNETQRRLAELQVLQQVSAALRVAHTVQEMIPIFITHATRAVAARAGSIYLLEEASGDWVSQGWLNERGEWIAMPGTALRHHAGEGVTGRVGATGEIYVTADWRTDPTIVIQPGEETLLNELGGGISLPLRSEQRIIGVMHVWFAQTPSLTEQTQRLLTAIADIAGNAIHRAALNEQTERHLRQLATLNAIDRAISSSFDLRLTLALVLEHVTAQLGVDAASILLWNPQTQLLEYAASRGFRTRAVEQARIRLGESFAGRVALERQSVHIRDLPTHAKEFVVTELVAEGFAEYYGIPLIAKGNVVGVMQIFHHAPLPNDKEWFDFCTMLAGQAALAIDNARLFNDLQQANMELARAYDATIEGWSRALDLRDKETEGHTQRVTELTLQLARAFGIRESDLSHVRRGALLHDIGKMGVPDSILLKPGTLTEAERAIMREHPRYAYELLLPIEYLRDALDIPYCHHEKWDGTGYPRGLQGEDIPFVARLFAVVDVYDALTSDRPYRPAWSKEQALAYLRDQAGKHFDPQVVEMFLKLFGASE